MPRYIDADKLSIYFNALAEHAEMEGLQNMAHIHRRCLQRIAEEPTADVVPKSEYDAVVSALDNSTQEFLRLHDDYQEATSEVEKLREINSLLTEAGQEWQKRYNNAKAEVVREIIEEIENRLLPSNTSGEFRGDSVEWFDYYDLHLAEDIAELKKKYVEGEG